MQDQTTISPGGTGRMSLEQRLATPPTITWREYMSAILFNRVPLSRTDYDRAGGEGRW